MRDVKESTERRARSAMRPFGYFHPTVASELKDAGNGNWILELKIERGPPVVVARYSVDIQGAGAGLETLQRWKSDWPLTPGKVLDQPLWDTRKQAALDLAEEEGYLLARFTHHTIELDLERNEAFLTLVLDTGEQAVMGDVTFNQNLVRPEILDNLPRFDSGDPYNIWLLERLRVDTWQTGYFNNIEVVEQRRLEESPPRVDFAINLEERPRNTYQGAIGIGSDTGPRLQFLWNRHLISSRGDSLSLGTGWQDHNDEFFVRGNYRLPRRVPSKQYWTADALLKKENQDLEFKESDDDEDFIKLANGDVRDYSAKLGRLRIRDRDRGFQRVFETIYVQALSESTEYALDPQYAVDSLLPLGGDEFGRITDTEMSYSIGVDWDMPLVRGNSFETVGHRQRAWVFTSNSAWGSDKDFSQIYLSSRWNFIRRENWKFLLRGEVGYSDADVDDIVIDVDGRQIPLSVTTLPNLYRFKAGGNNSVRGYGFEDLSNNGIGSNNIITASAEVERRVKGDWTLAAFFDVGNAFNDWGDTDLKRGVGVGFRWYTIAGAIRVDVAQALDLDGKPWRLHFTIGTPLL